MEANTNPSRRRAAPSKEVKAASKARSALVQQRLAELRKNLSARFEQISEETNRPVEYLEKLFYHGGELLKQERDVTKYNAYLHWYIEDMHEQGIPMDGKATLGNVSKKVAASGEWKSVPEDRMAVMVERLQDKRSEKPMQITNKTVGRQVNSGVSKIENELYNLHQGVHVEYVMFAIHSSVTDTWPMCVNATPRAAAGLEQLFKVTPEVMALTLQAFVTSGIEAALKVTKDNVNAGLRTIIRNDITSGLHEILKRERNITVEKLPRMEWANHDVLAVRFGVTLKEWPEPCGVRNPSHLKNSAALYNVKNALDSGKCHWVALSEEEWEAAKKAAGKGKGTKKRKSVSSDDDETSTDIDMEREVANGGGVLNRGGVTNEGGITNGENIYDLPFGLSESLYPPGFDAGTLSGPMASESLYPPGFNMDAPFEPSFSFDTDFQFVQGNSTMSLDNWMCQ
ncbi:hypothetical protein BC629DRAFT_1598571 [Irpex lacteus]|nr:hypothetical protein BC629DRAFT_1598571 [Irpex lacteus]